MAKRGRPRLDRPRIDLGTPELIKHRITMSPKDPTLSTSPIDTLLARGMISDEAHSAATYFNALRKLVFGKAHPPAIDLTAVSRGGLPEELDTADAERKYRDACCAMRGQSSNSFWAVENLVVHERFPAWLREGKGPRDSGLRHFMTGLGALVYWHKGRDKKAA